MDCQYDEEMRLHRIFFILVTAMAMSVSAQESKDSANTTALSAARFFGTFEVTSNYMNEAISQTNNSFAVQPTLGYVWPHAQIGIFTSNVQYPDNGESLNVRPFAWYMFVFGSGVELKAQYNLDMYFASNQRNGNIFRLDMNVHGQHGIIEQNANWYGTGQSGYWLAYQRSWQIPWSLEYKLEAGYLLSNASTYTSYFGVQTGLGYKYQDFNYELLTNFNSNAGQFAGTAAMAFWLTLTTKF